MSNLDRSAGGFFTYYLINLIAYLAFQSCFRMQALIFKSFDVRLFIVLFHFVR